MTDNANLRKYVFLYKNIPSEKAKEHAYAELIRIFQELAFDKNKKHPNKINDLISWHNEFLSTNDPYFTKEGRYFGNESYFSHFFYNMKDVSFRKTYYIFKIRNYFSESFFKAETPTPPEIFPWTIVEMKSNKYNILEPPFEIQGTFKVFETADDLVHYIDNFSKSHFNKI